MTENERDIELLRSDFPRLILRYQGTIRIILAKYVASGMIHRWEVEDMLQTINEGLLKRQRRIQAQYSGASLLRTYLSTIIRNLCLKQFHASRRHKREIPLEEARAVQGNSPVEVTLIREETARFRGILSLYHKELPKLRICLKLHFHLPVTREDVLAWHPGCSGSDMDFMLKIFAEDYESVDAREIFGLFTIILNQKEGKKNGPLAIQKWTDRRLKEILALMNGGFPAANHTRETLKILLEDYLCPFLQH